MRIGVDASNIRSGGGVTHLVELLHAAQPQEYGFDQVIVWGGSSTLSRLEERSWLRKVHEPVLDRSLPLRLYWQKFILERLVRRAECNVLLAPGGSYSGSFRPLLAMSQNMLPFSWLEARRYGASWIFLRLMLLRWRQSRTFRAANGVIFLTHYAREVAMQTVKEIPGISAVIPHGVDARFFFTPREQKYIGSYSRQHLFRVVYVSIVDFYKHQWHVAEAVAQLRETGLPIQLDLIGPAYPPALRRLRQLLRRLDPAEVFIHFRGPVPYSELPNWYHQADLFVFASSCENMPNILLESMASGLPIACSNRGPMPEILGDYGIYFDPEKPDEIADALRTLLEDPNLRAYYATGAYEKASAYSWERCARETFSFIAQVAQEFYKNKI
jgi:glycosyltransferase involved in cell wall biosynthesis